MTYVIQKGTMGKGYGPFCLSQPYVSFLVSHIIHVCEYTYE